MLLLLLSGFVLLSTVAADCTSDGNHVCINVYNKCAFTVWPGIQGSTVPEGGGFRLNSGQSRQLSVPNGWKAARIWARTGCDGNFNCDTGSCGGNSEQCQGRGGEPPVSLAEFTLNGEYGQDYYDVSLVDGYNIPVLIMPIEGTYSTNGGEKDCKMCGKCYKDVKAECPQALKVNRNGRTVACKSACLEFKTDQYCCRGAYKLAENCPTNSYAQIFKNCCPTAFSYAHDNESSHFVCRGNNGPSPAYTVQFCQ